MAVLPSSTVTVAEVAATVGATLLTVRSNVVVATDPLLLSVAVMVIVAESSGPSLVLYDQLQASSTTESVPSDAVRVTVEMSAAVNVPVLEAVLPSSTVTLDEVAETPNAPGIGCDSTAPMSTTLPYLRRKSPPRASVTNVCPDSSTANASLPLSIATLPGSKATVLTRPPLSSKTGTVPLFSMTVFQSLTSWPFTLGYAAFVKTLLELVALIFPMISVAACAESLILPTTILLSTCA